AGVDDARNDVVVHVACLPSEHLRDRHALFLGLVSQHRTDNNVTDCINARNVGLKMSVNLDAATLIERNAGCFEAEAIGVGTAAAASVTASPPFTGSNVTEAPLPSLVTAVTLALSWKSMPCLANSFCACLEISVSIVPKILSRYSTTVTFAPRRAHTEPSSRP